MPSLCRWAPCKVFIKSGYWIWDSQKGKLQDLHSRNPEFTSLTTCSTVCPCRSWCILNDRAVYKSGVLFSWCCYQNKNYKLPFVWVLCADALWELQEVREVHGVIYSHKVQVFSKEAACSPKSTGILQCWLNLTTVPSVDRYTWLGI